MEWNIQSRAAQCHGCQSGFVDQQAYHSLLFDERTGYQRLDVCEDCWTSQYSQGATSRKGFVSHWQGVFEVPRPKTELIRKETAETLLRRLVELDDPNYQAACYILAAMLERKRLLRVKDQIRRDGRRLFIYEHPKTGDAFTILDPELGLDQLQAVQRDVTNLLRNGLKAASTEPDAEAETAAEAASPAEPDRAVDAAPNS